MKFSQLLAFVTLFALVAACGGRSGDQQQSQTSQAEQEQEATDDVRTINIIGLDGMKFAVEEETDDITVSDTLGQNNDLRRLETIVVQPGEEIRINLTTRSQLPATAMAHNWVLLTMETDPAAFASAAIQAKANDYIPQDQTDKILAQTGLAAGGETVSVTFTAPDTPGEYEYVCTFPGHFSAGMRGTLVVKE